MVSFFCFQVFNYIAFLLEKLLTKDKWYLKNEILLLWYPGIADNHDI